MVCGELDAVGVGDDGLVVSVFVVLGGVPSGFEVLFAL